MEPAGAASVFLFALLTAVATGLGAVPFALAKHPARRWRYEDGVEFVEIGLSSTTCAWYTNGPLKCGEHR